MLGHLFGESVKPFCFKAYLFAGIRTVDMCAYGSAMNPAMNLKI